VKADRIALGVNAEIRSGYLQTSHRARAVKNKAPVLTLALAVLALFAVNDVQAITVPTGDAEVTVHQFVEGAGLSVLHRSGRLHGYPTRAVVNEEDSRHALKEQRVDVQIPQPARHFSRPCRCPDNQTIKIKFAVTCTLPRSIRQTRFQRCCYPRSAKTFENCFRPEMAARSGRMHSGRS
jgi:hypothetical protein